MTYEQWMAQMGAAHKPDVYREGQWWYNSLHDVRPDLSAKVYETHFDENICDPFYDNKYLDAFHAFVMKNW